MKTRPWKTSSSEHFHSINHNTFSQRLVRHFSAIPTGRAGWSRQTKTHQPHQPAVAPSHSPRSGLVIWLLIVTGWKWCPISTVYWWVFGTINSPYAFFRDQLLSPAWNVAAQQRQLKGTLWVKKRAHRYVVLFDQIAAPFHQAIPHVKLVRETRTHWSVPWCVMPFDVARRARRTVSASGTQPAG